jgi:hypothetical protein
MIMLAVINRITSACTRRLLRAWADTSNDSSWPVDLPEATFASGRVPVFTTGRRQTAVRRTPDFRSCTTGMCCLAVSRPGLLIGAYRPEAVVRTLEKLLQTSRHLGHTRIGGVPFLPNTSRSTTAKPR